MFFNKYNDHVFTSVFCWQHPWINKVFQVDYSGHYTRSMKEFSDLKCCRKFCKWSCNLVFSVLFFGRSFGGFLSMCNFLSLINEILNCMRMRDVKWALVDNWIRFATCWNLQRRVLYFVRYIFFYLSGNDKSCLSEQVAVRILILALRIYCSLPFFSLKKISIFNLKPNWRDQSKKDCGFHKKKCSVLILKWIVLVNFDQVILFVICFVALQLPVWTI